jgi:hypothetical protein
MTKILLTLRTAGRALELAEASDNADLARVLRTEAADYGAMAR